MAIELSESSNDASTTARPAREVALEAAALDAARMWTEATRGGLAREGRPIAGGFPGTVNEARARSGEVAARVLVKLSLPPMTHDELGRVTRIAYDEARRLWRANVRPAA